VHFQPLFFLILKIFQLLRKLWQFKDGARFFLMSADISIVTYTVMLRILRCEQMVSAYLAMLQRRKCNSSAQNLQFFNTEFWGV
jgi:hypothetical protein